MEEKNLNNLKDECYKIAVEHGWWDEKREVGTILALIHSEISEGLEEYRENGLTEDFWVEMADVVIRILDFCGRNEIDIERILLEKMNKNRKRKYRHGGKKI